MQTNLWSLCPSRSGTLVSLELLEFWLAGVTSSVLLMDSTSKSSPSPPPSLLCHFFSCDLVKSMGSTGKEGDTLGAQTDLAIQKMT